MNKGRSSRLKQTWAMTDEKLAFKFVWPDNNVTITLLISVTKHFPWLLLLIFSMIVTVPESVLRISVRAKMNYPMIQTVMTVKKTLQIALTAVKVKRSYYLTRKKGKK